MEDFINETAGIAGPVKAGKRWLVTLAKPGVGSMGKYPEEMLRSTGPDAFPAGTKAFFTHESRDPRDQVGTYGAAFWNDEVGELQAHLTPFPRFEGVLEEAGPNIEASIHAKVVKSPDGTIKALVPHRSNTVDLVAFAGLEGSGLKHHVESLFAAAAADSEIEGKKEENVEITKEMWDGLSGSITSLATKFETFASESLKEAQGVADEAVVNAKVEEQVAEKLSSIAEQEAAIDKADVPTEVKEALKTSVRKGEDITTALESAVSIVAAAKKELIPDPSPVRRGKVVVVDESHTETKNFSVGRWGSSAASAK